MSFASFALRLLTKPEAAATGLAYRLRHRLQLRLVATRKPARKYRGEQTSRAARAHDHQAVIVKLGHALAGTLFRNTFADAISAGQYFVARPYRRFIQCALDARAAPTCFLVNPVMLR